jgi:outer membrane protein assembly factor BamA
MLAFIFSFVSIFFQDADSVVRPGVNVFADSLKLQTLKVKPDSNARFVEVNRIFFIGNRITRDQIINRELSIKPGDIVFTGDLPGILDLDRKKLINLRLFNKVEIRTLELDQKKIDVLVDVSERWYTFPTPVFELSDRNFNEWWQNYNHSWRRVYYGMRLYQYNMRGRNETVRLVAQLGFARKFELSYRIPYIDKKQKQGLTFEVAYQETKNLAFKTENHKYQFFSGSGVLRQDRVASVTYSYRKTFYQTHAAKLEYRYMNIADTVRTLNSNYLRAESQFSNQRYTTLVYQFTSDHRDFFAYPLKGYQLIASIAKLGIGNLEDVNKFDINVSYSKFFDLKRKFYLSNNVIGYWSTPQNLAYTNYGVLGLRKQFVRGYEVYVIEGPYFAVNKMTFKKLLFSRVTRWEAMPIEQFRHVPISIYFKTYADVGYVRNYSDYREAGRNTLLSDKAISGAGFGFDVIGSYDLVLRFEYTWNSIGQRGFFFHIKREF